MSEKEIVEIAGRYLKDKHPGGVTLEALTQGVRHEQDWWYVPVRPSFEPPRRYEYYEVLAEVEGALEDEEHLTVLFLPTAPENENIVRESVNGAGGGNYADIVNSVLRAHIDAQEDAALIRAIKEGEGSGKVRREEVFDMLQRQN